MPTPSATPSLTPSPSTTSTPDATAHGKSINGAWCPTVESDKGPNGKCVVIEMPKVIGFNGGSVTIGGPEHPQNGATYDISPGPSGMGGAPFGIYYAPGHPIEGGLPDYYKGKDDVDAERIWNPQVNVMLERANGKVVPGFPGHLQGKWCSQDGSQCFDLRDMVAKYPDMFVDSLGSSPSREVPGATDDKLCMGDPELTTTEGAGQRTCAEADSLHIRFVPAGVDWNCEDLAQRGTLIGSPSSCSPDFTDEQDSSKPRLMLVPAHQNPDGPYEDSKPLYSLG